jgi:hypothetical protein
MNDSFVVIRMALSIQLELLLGGGIRLHVVTTTEETL